MAAISPIRVLFLSAEVAPLIKVGGLGDVAGSLPPALSRSQLPGQPQIDIRVALPYYPSLKRQKLVVEPACRVKVLRKGKPVQGVVYQTLLNGLITYLIDGEPFDNDEPIYSADPELDGEKFVFFSLAALDMLNKQDWKPDILHANDWHSAAALYSDWLRDGSKFGHEQHKRIITIHNLPFMGREAENAMAAYGLPCAVDAHLPRWGTLFPLPLGMLAADRVVTVSPSYAAEILTPEFGSGLQDFLFTIRGKLTGILNGLDTAVWDPSTDPEIVNNYSAPTVNNRILNKLELQKEMELPEDPSTPLLTIISRLDQQKGIDIALDGLRQLGLHDWQLVLLGSGNKHLEASAFSLESQFPKKVRVNIKFDPQLSHRLYSAADMILMPSRYEPCGLAQMIAMRYGCIPIARATGGLIDTITDDPSGIHSTGFLFTQQSPDAYNVALRRALFAFQQPSLWAEIQQRAMYLDFSWDQSAVKYIDLYANLVDADRTK